MNNPPSEHQKSLDGISLAVIDLLKEIRARYGEEADSVLGGTRAEKISSAHYWAIILRPFSDETIRDSWLHCREGFRRPPNAAQFANRCAAIEIRQEQETRVPPPGVLAPHTALPDVAGGHPSFRNARLILREYRSIKKSSPEFAARQIDAIRSILGGGPL